MNPVVFSSRTIRSASDVDALAQFIPVVLAHLLAAISLADRQNPDRFYLETRLLGDVRENQIYGHGRTFVVDIIVDHTQGGCGLERSNTGEDDESHRSELIPPR